MALRLIEITLPLDQKDSMTEALSDFREDLLVFELPAAGRLVAKLTLAAEKTEQVMDLLDKRFSALKEFKINLLAIEAALPRPKDETAPEGLPSKEKVSLRVGREELYHDIVGAAQLNQTYLLMVFLSSVVASIGLIRENVAAIIGAMVIAPLLGPNVALSLATTLGDMPLVWKALKVNLCGMLFAFLLAVFCGVVFTIPINTNAEIASRTAVHLSDIILALASGCAGALAFTTGISAVLVGVMVAVALLPPLVVFGLMVGAGAFEYALGAGLLVLTNIICVNLAGVATFLFQGIRPASWWEADKAKKATMKALFIWSLLLATLIAAILLSG